MSVAGAVRTHYSADDPASVIRAAIEREFGPDGPLSIEQLAPLDEFHIGGRQGTDRLFDALELNATARVVDLGAGLGGAARHAAHTFGCEVTGVDLTPAYCEIGRMLNARTGLQERVVLREGDACDTGLPAGAFDTTFTMHVAMNIEDKGALYREAARLLAPGGKLGIYDVMAGPNAEPLTFPVPWASTQQTSFLAPPTEVQALLEQAGFEIEQVRDERQFALDFFARLAASKAGPAPIGLHLVLGSTAKVKTANMVQNIRTERCAPHRIIARRG